MPNTDAYEWLKTNMPQDIMQKNPFSNYQYNFINDINSLSYNNQSQSLVQYDLSGLYNSSNFSDTSTHFILIPILRCAEALDVTPAKVALTQAHYNLTTLKNLNTCLIHQVDLILGGKTVHQLTPFTNLATGVRLLSELSNDDLTLYGNVLGISAVDNPNSMTYMATATNLYASPSIANNRIVGTPYQTGDASVGTTQGAGLANNALQLKSGINRAVGAVFSGLQSIAGISQLREEFQPTFEIVNGQAVWTDYCVIFLKDILDAMDKIGVIRRLDGILRLYVNTGFTRVVYPADNQMTFVNGNTTFTDTCPIMVNYMNAVNAIPVANVRSLNVGVFIGAAPSYTFNGTTFSGITHPLRSSRYYYNQLTIQPSLALDYISSNSSKTVIYENYLFNTFINIGGGNTFSQLIQSGVTNIKAIILMPFISSTVAGADGFPAWKSPFDPVGGCAGHPCSLTNLQVQIGGVNVLSTSLNYSFENFVQQVSKFNKQSSSEYGVESGLISQQFWNNNRFYLVNVRSTEDDLNTPRNVVISFKNNSLLAIDVVCFVVYEDKLTINVATGIINK